MVVAHWTGIEVLALRKAAMRFTQKQFGEKIGCHINTVYNWEKRGGQFVLDNDWSSTLDAQIRLLTDEERARFFAALNDNRTHRHDAATDTIPVQAAQSTMEELRWAPPATDDANVLPADTGLDLPWTAEGALRAVGAVTEADPMHRRVVLTLIGAAMTAPAHHWLITSPTAALNESARRRRTEMSTVDELDLLTASLRRLDDGGAGDVLLASVRATLHHVIGLLDNTSYSDTTGRRLYATAGELLRLAGWLCFDNAKHGHAQRYWLAALRAAHTSGDRALAANILGFMSCQAKDISCPREAVTLAESARAGYRGATPRISAILSLRAAEAHAADSAETDCRRAIDEAFSHLASPTITTGPDWSYWLSPGHAHGQAGYCYLRLHRYSDARRHLREALRLQAPTDTREAALRYTLLAKTYAQQPHPDIDHAVSFAEDATDLLADTVNSTR